MNSDDWARHTEERQLRDEIIGRRRQKVQRITFTIHSESTTKVYFSWSKCARGRKSTDDKRIDKHVNKSHRPDNIIECSKGARIEVRDLSNIHKFPNKSKVEVKYKIRSGDERKHMKKKRL